MNIQRVVNGICDGCGLAADSVNGLCESCCAHLPWLQGVCACCARPQITSTIYCGDCIKHRPGFDRVICPLHYSGHVQRLVTSLKFGHSLWVAQTLAELMWLRLGAADKGMLARPNVALIPVPAQRDRLRDRGFSPAAEIARCIAKLAGVSVRTDITSRLGARPAQSGLSSRAARRDNVRGVFKSIRKAPKTVVVIDDVLTTGATADALAVALLASGAESVSIWVAARAG